MDTQKLITALEKARELIANGWNEPFSLDANGQICAFNDKGLARVCVDDALLISAENAEYLQMGDLLEAQLHARNIDSTLSRWLASPKRQHAEVLRLFERTIAHLRVAA